MSTLILLSIAMMAPTVFSLPVPQYKLPDKSLSPEGVAAMGALTTSITTDDGDFSSTHPHPPPSYGYGGYNYNKKNGPTYETVTLDVTKAGGVGPAITYEQSYKRQDTPVGTAPYGGETTTLDVTKAGGVGPPITYEQSYKRHVPPPPPEHDSDTFTKPPKRESLDTPVGTATIGGLTSSLTLGDGKQKIQDNAVVMGGLTSSISLQESNPVRE